MQVMRRMIFPTSDQITLTGVLYALSDPTRLEIVRQLAVEGEKPCCEFGFPISKSTLSHHFRVLRDAGIVYTRTAGTQSVNSIRREALDALFPGLLDTILQATVAR